MIDLIPTDEQQEIADTLAGFLADTLPVERFRDSGMTEADPAVWTQLAEIGAFGISATEAAGGLGLAMAEEVLAFREYGRFLVSPAVLGTVLAIRIASAAGEDELAAALVGGTRRAGLGLVAPTGVRLFDVRPDDLVVVWDEDGASLFDLGVLRGVTAQPCTDATVTMALVDALPDKPLARVAADTLPLPAMATILLAAMLCGMIEAIRDQAVAFAKDRYQFGRPIGSFQAIKHRCADMACGAEAAWSQTVYAALAHDAAIDDATFHAVNAKLIAGTYALDAARTNIQVHGGIGFTAEITAHLYLKRIHLLNELGGNPRLLRSRLNKLAVAG